jgi:mRNA-degrading endonuclease YafQ of YafQ-DinJ toxin-antitoxin module
MQTINKVVTTSLYWKTLGELRGTPRYEKIRSEIRELVQKKAESRMPVNARDKVFNDRRLATLSGIWHCSISRNPDVVLFYEMNGDTLTLGMLGKHDDFPSGGQNFARANGVGSRIRNSIEQGHVPTPQWESVRWSRPSDLLNNAEVHELSVAALQQLSETLYIEAQDAPLFARLHGHDILEADEGAIEAWLTEVEAANDHIMAVMQKPLASPDVVISGPTV